MKSICERLFLGIQILVSNFVFILGLENSFMCIGDEGRNWNTNDLLVLIKLDCRDVFRTVSNICDSS